MNQFLFRSPDPTDPSDPITDPVTDPQPEKTYSAAEVEEIKKRIRSAGFNDGKTVGRRESIAPYLEKARKTPGFEEIADLDEPTYAEILNLASARKRNMKHDEEMQAKNRELQTRAERAEQRYKDREIDYALNGIISADEKGNPRANNPAQVVKLLRADFKFDLVEENGKSVVRVLDMEGNPVRKDAFEYKSAEDLINEFLARNQHFVPGAAKASTDAKPKTGIPGTNKTDEEIARTPVHMLNVQEKARFKQLFKEGKINALTGALNGV